MTSDVNNLQEVCLLLKEINTAIRLLYKLSDEYYTQYIFNSNTDTDAIVGKTDYFEVAGKLECLRSVLYGNEVIDWDLMCLNLNDEMEQSRENMTTKYHELVKEYLSSMNMTFAEKMQELGVKKVETATELLEKHKRLRYDQKKIVDQWLTSDLRFLNIDEIHCI